MLPGRLKRGRSSPVDLLKRNFPSRQSFVASFLLLFALTSNPTVLYMVLKILRSQTVIDGLCIKIARMSKREVDLCDQQHDCITPFGQTVPTIEVIQ